MVERHLRDWEDRYRSRGQVKLSNAELWAIVVICICSIAASLWIMSQPIRLYWYTKQLPGTILMLVGFKASCDFLQALKYGVSVYLTIYSQKELMSTRSSICIATGVIGNWTAAAAAACNLCIAYDCSLLIHVSLRGMGAYDSKVKLPRYFVFIVCLATLSTGLISTSYGPSGDGTCWVDYHSIAGNWRVFALVLPIFGCQAFCLGACIHMVRNWRRLKALFPASSTKQNGNRGPSWLVWKIFLFNLAFILSWVLNMTIRTYQFAGINMPLTALKADYILLVSIGLWDVLVWFTSFESKVSDAGGKTVPEIVESASVYVREYSRSIITVGNQASSRISRRTSAIISGITDSTAKRSDATISMSPLHPPPSLSTTREESDSERSVGGSTTTHLH